MGGTKQIQLMRNAATMTKTAISQKQSLEVVQTLIHGSLSSLSYLRNFFPEKAFDHEIVEFSGTISYKDYADGKLARNSKLAKKPCTALEVMRRGRSKRVDLFLDWLELGAFTALKDGHLKAIQIYVHADADDRAKVIEMYTLTIKYLTDGEGRLVAGIEVGSPDNSIATVEATMSSMQKLLRDIMELCSALPDLPEKRYVSMAIFYLQDEGIEYRPHGFMPSSTEYLKFAHGSGWHKETTTLQALQSGYHNTNIAISHLQQSEIGGLSLITGPPRLPAQLEYSVITSKADDISVPRTSDDMTLNSEPAAEAHSSPDKTPSTIVDQESEAHLRNHVHVQQTETPAPTSQTALRSMLVENGAEMSTSDQSSQMNSTKTQAPPFPQSLDTQSSNVPYMKRALQGMMQPERLTQGDTQTQGLMRQPQLYTLTSQPLTKGSLTLKPQITRQLEQNANRLRKSAMKCAKPGSDGEDIVLCQCDHRQEEADMVNCSYCGTWQHLHCYGFSGASDPRIPKHHACYQCLVGGNDPATFDVLRKLVLQRRAMSFALQNGLKRKGDLAKLLGVSTDDAATVLKHLRSEGFVTATALSHKPGFAKTGKPHFVPVTDGSRYERMLSSFFNPVLHIEGYYESVDLDSVTIKNQVLLLRSIPMPPPAAPSPMRKATPTTASGLDPRSSMSPYQTPIRGPVNPSKRAAERHNIFATPAKRAATNTALFRRLQSVQSRFLLNADGLSSSPMPPA